MSTQPDPAAVQEMIDKVAIGELQSRYMFAIDWQDAAAYGSVFTEDAKLEWPEGSAQGRDAIQNMVVGLKAYRRKLAEASAPNKPAALRHFVTNRVIKIDGDRATAVAYWLDINNDNQIRTPYVPGYGHYEDELIRTADGWRFTSRKVFNETTSSSPADNPAW